MSPQTNDMRVQRTLDSIHSTFRQMICEMDYEKITVKELCRRARINPKTFYRYYPTLDDLLMEFQQDISLNYLRRIKDYKIPEDLELITRAFLQQSIDMGEVYERVSCSESYRYISKKMESTVMNSTWPVSHAMQRYDKYELNIIMSYVNESGATMYRQWVRDGKKVPFERMVDMVTTLQNRGMQGLLDLDEAKEQSSGEGKQ